jgi:hypothetical protein
MSEQHARVGGVGSHCHIGGQARLANPRLARHEDHASAPAGGDNFKLVHDGFELGDASDECTNNPASKAVRQRHDA